MRTASPRLVPLVAAGLAALLGAGCTRAPALSSPPPEAGPDAGTVHVASQPPGLEVAAGGVPRCRTPCDVRLDPGLHRLSIRAPGYMPWQEDVVVPARGEVNVTASLVGSH